MVARLPLLASAPFFASLAPDITVREPVAPVSSQVRLVVDCGGRTLEVRGHGDAIPRQGQAEIFIDGNRLRGAEVDRLRRDLSEQTAFYRLVVRCRRPDRGFWLLISQISRRSGAVTYRTASAVFGPDGLEAYSGLEEGDADDMW